MRAFFNLLIMKVVFEDGDKHTLSICNVRGAIEVETSFSFVRLDKKQVEDLIKQLAIFSNNLEAPENE